jgi:hypothetical protein
MAEVRHLVIWKERRIIRIVAVQIRGTVSCVLYDKGSLKFVTGLHLVFLWVR